MTPAQAKTLLPVIQAFAEGKTVQSALFNDAKWQDDHDPTFDPRYNYRIKPAATIRPWKPEEVPVGAVVRHNEDGARMLIDCVEDGVVFLSDDDKTSDMRCLLADYKWRFPQETEWKACGVADE